MTRFLWTGESEFCVCSHHIEEHDEASPSSGNTEVCISTNYCQCLSMVPESEKCKCSHCLTRCKCNKFTPYRELKPYSFEL